MMHNEDSRVKIPSILHLSRLGYTYLSLKGNTWDKRTNIFTDIFRESISKINPGIEEEEIGKLKEDILLDLENEDIGRAFYERLTKRSGIKLLDFEDFGNNTFHVVTELTYKNGDDEFRPDIILLINGMPLVFIEVKKPNNREGIIAERKRMDTRFSNKQFRRFANITQLMIFSNNMEYDNESIEQIQGGFYASASYSRHVFNYFREEEDLDIGTLLAAEDDKLENHILNDTNAVVIKHNQEFQTNKDPDTPTNRILTSLVSKDRLAFILRYAIAYVRERNGSKILMFDFERLKQETSLFDNLHNKIIKQRQENQQLASLRDWLLPMLMNGQVTMREAAEWVGGVL